MLAVCRLSFFYLDAIPSLHMGTAVHSAEGHNFHLDIQNVKRSRFVNEAKKSYIMLHTDSIQKRT